MVEVESEDEMQETGQEEILMENWKSKTVLWSPVSNASRWSLVLSFLFQMAAYNRRWYILASIVAGLGIGLIGASLGTEELVEMTFTDIDMGSYFNFWYSLSIL